MDAVLTEAQLELIDEPTNRTARDAGARPRGWHLDAREREVGLRGVAQARQALAAARRPVPAHLVGNQAADTQPHADAA